MGKNNTNYYIGHSTDNTVRHRASSGGIGTALTKYLLSTDDYGTSITFEFDTDETKYKPILIHNSDEVNIKGSIYHDVEIARFVNQNIDNIKGGLVVTCPPCQVAAIKQICKKSGINAFVISYCCSGQTTIEGTWKYYELLGIDKNEVVDMQYRGNGWPSGIQIRLKDGRSIYKNNYTEPWVTLHRSWLYRPNKCFFCKRDTGKNADISLADPWLDEYKKQDDIGNTMFVVFSDKGRNVIDNMTSLGLIKYVESDYYEYSIAQKPNIHKEIMVLEHMTYLKRINKLISNKYYHKWATSSLSNMNKHLTIMSFIRRTESVKSIINSIMNLLNKIKNRIRRIYYSKVMNTSGTNFNIGKSKEMKKYVIISGYNLRQPNRGNAALAYGTVSFLLEKGWLKEGQEIVRFHYYNNPLKKKNRMMVTEKNVIDGIEWTSHVIPVHRIQAWLLMKFGILLPFTRFKKFVKQVEYEAADYGGDGFSDIYGDQTYMSRFYQTLPLWKLNIPLIVLPQTIGPFKKKENYDFAVKILKRAKHVFVRDSKFEDELKKLGIPYERTKDLSAFMKPEPWDVELKKNAIGINVSGLAYSNRFRTLSGQFDAYPELIDRLICHFRDKGHTVYLIPHSYNYNEPEDTNDDIVACREAFDRLKNKDNVVFIDKDLISPRVKYVISQMSFFIGTRMHANFAAIYTNVPLFGLAYSYKFEGAFNANGLDGAKQTVMINNINDSDIDSIIQKIDNVYHELVK